MEEEIWKNIVGFEGYQVSNLGRVKTHNKVTFTKKHGYRLWKDRILKIKWSKATKNKNRYDGRVCLWKDGKDHTLLVARLVATAFLGKSNLTVNHIDGDSTNNNVNNLEWCSIAENIKKGYETGAYDKTMKSVILISKINNEQKIFRSLAKASEFMLKSKGYLSFQIKHNKFENEQYKWQLNYEN